MIPPLTNTFTQIVGTLRQLCPIPFSVVFSSIGSSIRAQGWRQVLVFLRSKEGFPTRNKCVDMEKAKMAYGTKIDYDKFQKLPFNGRVARNTSVLL